MVHIRLTLDVEGDLRAGARARAVGGLADVGPGGRAVHALDHQRPLVDHDAAARVRKQFLPLKAKQEERKVLSSCQKNLGALSTFPFETSFIVVEKLSHNFWSVL